MPAGVPFWFAMPLSGSITLGDIAPQLTMLEIACQKCERYGRLSIARLIDEHGPDMTLPELRGVIAGDCPKQRSISIDDRCGVHYPQLGGL